jgi:hypothetical protein
MGLSYEKTNISKMKKDFSNFLLKILYLTDSLWCLPKIIFISQNKKENGGILLSLQPLLLTIKGSEKNDPNLRNGILGKCVTPFIL